MRRAEVFVIAPLLILGCASPSPAPKAKHAPAPQGQPGYGQSPAIGQPGAMSPPPLQQAPASAPGVPNASLGSSGELLALKHDLDVAEQVLAKHLARQRTLAAQGAASVAPEQPSADVDASGRRTRDSKVATGKRAESATEQRAGLASPCDLACRAWASMKRAAKRICELTTEQDPLCERARARVATAREQIDSNGCGCLSENE